MQEYHGHPLFSVIVVTFNSEKYVLETLESIFNQTYEYIELIITDDGSTDQTVTVCSEWLNTHKERFVNTLLITTEKNTGIPANCNRGVQKSKGTWIKLIAGDDLLLNDCIEKGVAFINTSRDIHIFASNVVFFVNDFGNENRESSYQSAKFFLPETNAETQFKILLHNNPITAPSVFISREVYDLNEGFNETIPMMEDYPFWIKTVRNGIKIYFLNATTIGYRLHQQSVSGFNNDKLFNAFYVKHYIFQKEYTFMFMSFFEKMHHRYVYRSKKVFDALHMNALRFKFLFSVTMKLNAFRFFIRK